MLLLLIKIVFWTSLFALLHSYVIYPLIINILAKNKKLNQKIYNSDDDLPFISVIMAVRNAESVILEKIKSIYKNGYPINKIEFLIGSDASNDQTNEIISSCIKVVCSNLQNRISENKGVFVQEDIYLKSEIKLKYNEGILWGNLMGAYGAFFAIRKNEFSLVPKNFLVDDFFISFNALRNGKKAILEPLAVVYEKISGSIQDEFKRKIRISSGNFQNLKEFAHILFSDNRSLAFCFFSHKVTRWFGPVFILLTIISASFLFKHGSFYQVFATLLFFSLITPIIDYFLRKFGIHIILLRFISHYYYMNLGLLIGLLKYIKGVKTNVWEPTKRESKF